MVSICLPRVSWYRACWPQPQGTWWSCDTGMHNSRCTAIAPAWCIESRTSISTASRSIVPALCQSPNTICTIRPTSWATSCWIASAVFFLWGQSVLNRPQFANFLVDFQQIVTELTEEMELSDLLLRLAQSRRCAEGLRNGLSVHFASQAIERTMTRIIGPVTMATRVATSSASAGNRPGTHIAESTDLELSLRALGLQHGKRIGHQ